MNSIRLAKRVESNGLFEKIEECYRITVPRDVCSFLKMNSRGIPKKKIMLLNDNEYLLSGFVSVDEEDKINMLSIAIRLRNEDGMEKFLPFATDGFGNYYGIEFEGESPMKIVFYEAECGKTSFVCKEFKEIIRALDLEELGDEL